MWFRGGQRVEAISVLNGPLIYRLKRVAVMSCNGPRIEIHIHASSNVDLPRVRHRNSDGYC